MGLFGARLPIDRDELDWQLATFKWLIDRFGGTEVIAENPPFVPMKPSFQ